MLSRWKAFLLKQQTVSEDSILLRAAVTVLVMFALVLTLQQLEWPDYWPAVLLITPAASILSYFRRKSANLEIKIFLSFAMIALLLWFFTRLTATLYDPRIPLAELLIWLQVLHAFDLPAKKDLRYTCLVALILMAIACVLTYSSYFGALLLLFCVLFLIVLTIDFWAGNRTASTVVEQSQKGSHKAMDLPWLGASVGKALPLALLGAGLIFIFMPRFQGLKLRSLPMSWDVQFSLGQVSNGEIRNPSLSREGQDSQGKPQRIEGDSYFGFDSEVNLNARGSLSERVVMKVRTSNWQYHRAVTFAEYTGSGWKGIPWEPEKRTVKTPPFFFPSVNWRNERVTIYYAETDLPNIVFTPSTPRRVYFPSNEIYDVTSFEPDLVPKNVLNTPATIVSPFYLEEGAVYSILNQVPDIGTAELVKQESDPQELVAVSYFATYLQLSQGVSERTKELAARLVEPHSSPWARAAALSTHLQQNYTYDLEVDYYPEAADTVDHFLFEKKIGYCEQFASTLCVMARSVGLPARYVTGYLPGTYNPISGFYEVKASDAHAWAEIYIQNYGWMIFDPVPGENATPQLGDNAENKWLLESLLEYLNLPPVLRENLPTLLRIFAGLALATLILGLLKRPKRKQGVVRSALFPYLQRAEKIVPARAGGETVRQWAERLKEHPCLLIIAEIYEAKFYRGLPLSVADRESLENAVRALKDKNVGIHTP